MRKYTVEISLWKAYNRINLIDVYKTNIPNLKPE